MVRSYRRLVWDAWNAYLHRAGSYQSQVLLTAVYGVIVGPSVLLARVLGTRLLDLGGRPRDTYWIERPPTARSIEWLERQF